MPDRDSRRVELIAQHRARARARARARLRSGATAQHYALLSTVGSPGWR